MQASLQAWFQSIAEAGALTGRHRPLVRLSLVHARVALQSPSVSRFPPPHSSIVSSTLNLFDCRPVVEASSVLLWCLSVAEKDLPAGPTVTLLCVSCLNSPRSLFFLNRIPQAPSLATSHSFHRHLHPRFAFSTGLLSTPIRRRRRRYVWFWVVRILVSRVQRL